MKKVHISWFVCFLSLGFILGAAIAPLMQRAFFGSTESIVIALSLFAFAVFNKRVYFISFALVAGLILGSYRADITLEKFSEYNSYYGKWVELAGKVSEDTTITSGGEQRIKLKDITIAKTELDGQVWVEIDSNSEIKRSDVVELEGLLGEGFGSFQASMPRAQFNKVTKIEHSDVAREVRDWFSDGIKRVVQEPQASLGIGYLTGQRNTLPEELDDNLRLLGLTHIVVASGFNLTILVRFTRRAFAKISKYLATVAGFAMMIGFILVTGFSPSMSRAGIVTGLSLLAWYFGRKIHPFVLLPLAASITVFLNPSFLWGDIGWYLSFAAFAGVIILAPLLRHFFFGEQKSGNLKQILVETASAQVMTMPIIALVFGQYSVLAVPANLLILPLVSLAMLLTFIGGVAAISSLSVAPVFGLPAQAVLDYMTTTIDKLAALPFAEGELNFTVAYLVASYVAMLILAVLIWRRTKHDFKQDSIVE